MLLYSFSLLGTIELESGNVVGARAVLEEGVSKYPGDQFILQRWGTLEAKHGSVNKARELFKRSVMIQPHAPTFVAWAILEEEEGMKALAPLPQAIAETLIASNSPPSGVMVLNSEAEDVEGSSVISAQYALDPSLSSRENRAAAQTFAKKQILKARELFGIGLAVNPQHGPMYHAYGNMEMVIFKAITFYLFAVLLCLPFARFLFRYYRLTLCSVEAR